MPQNLKTSLPILHRLAQDACEVFFGHLFRGPYQEALLLHGAVYEVVYVVLRVAELADAARGADVLHEAYQDLGQRVLVGVVYRPPGQELGDLLVALRHGIVGEAEGRGRGDYHGPAVRDEGVVRRVSGRLPLVLEAGYGVGAGVRDVDARRAEADAGERRPEHHRAPGLHVLAVLHGPPEVLAAELEGLAAPHVRDRVRPLVWRPVVRAVWLGAGVVGLGKERLGGVADHVEAAGGRYLRGHGHGQERVDEAAVGTQVLVGDARLHPLIRDVED